MSPSVLNCPSCGAVISSDATQCPYCTAKLATVACPSCFGLAFIGSKFCPHCGKPLPASVEASVTLTCPRCKAEMEHKDLSGTSFAECPKCAGLWIKSETFDQICNDREKSSAVLGQIFGPNSVPVADQKAFYLHCPQCHELMNRLNFAHRSGIIIDICKPHGIWFDTDELKKIIDFIQAGGLERAREIEKEQLDEVRRQLQNAQISNSAQDLPNIPSPMLASTFGRADWIDVAFSVAGGIVSAFLK